MIRVRNEEEYITVDFTEMKRTMKRVSIVEHL